MRKNLNDRRDAEARRIFFTVTNDLNYDQRMQRICTSLACTGFDCWLIGRKKPDSKPLADFPFFQKRLPCFFQKGPLFYLEFNLRLFVFLMKTRHDCICTIDLDTMPGGCLAGLICGRKRVFDAHEFFTEVPEVIDRPIIKLFWKIVEWLFVRHYHAAYTVGESLAAIFSEKLGMEFGVIRNVPFQNREPLSVKSTTGKPVIFYQGALNEGRGIESAIEAMKQLDSSELWLAGEGDLSEKLRKMVVDFGLEDRVKFLGFVRPADLKTLTDQAWLGLNLLENRGLSYFHSLANKCFDYIQAGKPALNMNFPEYRKINAAFETSILLDDCSVDKIVQSVLRLKNDNMLYQRLVENCGRAAEEFTWEKEEVKLTAIYTQLLVK